MDPIRAFPLPVRRVAALLAFAAAAFLPLAAVYAASSATTFAPPAKSEQERPLRLAQGAHSTAQEQQEKEEVDEDKLTPEQKMARRFPQPVRVGFLVGLPVLDWRDYTIGYIREVVRTPEGKIQLVVPYRPWLGFLGCRGLWDFRCRPVAVPLETVAILARQVAALDMSREAFDAAPTFKPDATAPLAADATIRIAITRR